MYLLLRSDMMSSSIGKATRSLGVGATGEPAHKVGLGIKYLGASVQGQRFARETTGGERTGEGLAALARSLLSILQQE